MQESWFSLYQQTIWELTSFYHKNLEFSTNLHPKKWPLQKLSSSLFVFPPWWGRQLLTSTYCPSNWERWRAIRGRRLHKIGAETPKIHTFATLFSITKHFIYCQLSLAPFSASKPINEFEFSFLFISVRRRRQWIIRTFGEVYSILHYLWGKRTREWSLLMPVLVREHLTSPPREGVQNFRLFQHPTTSPLV